MISQGSRPNASPTRARGPDQRVVKDQGHFYCWAWKDGTEKVRTSGYEPWRDYSVKGIWIDELWSGHKLSHEVYLDYAARVRVGFANRLRQVEAVRTHEQSHRVRGERQAVAAALAPAQAAFQPWVAAALGPWMQQYTRELPRYHFLVLRGASRTGKSTLARGLGGTPFVQTVQSAKTPDPMGVR